MTTAQKISITVILLLGSIFTGIGVYFAMTGDAKISAPAFGLSIWYLSLSFMRAIEILIEKVKE